jgi:hypothetical protein
VQTVRKLTLSGFLRGVGHVRITHDAHRRIGTRPASVAAGGGGRLYRLAVQVEASARELLAVDGTRIKAVNNKDRNFTRSSRESSSAAPMSGWKTTSSGSTRAMSRMARPGAARVRRTWPKRLRRSARSAAVAKHCWPARPNRRGPDLVDRSRQPRHGRAYEGRRRLQHSSGGRREE